MHVERKPIGHPANYSQDGSAGIVTVSLVAAAGLNFMRGSPLRIYGSKNNAFLVK
jgi:hypothetical protein